MTLKVTFSKPQNVGASDLDGVVLRFPFAVQKVHGGAEKDTSSNHSISVQISGSLQTMWGLDDRGNPTENLPLVKTLFEHARREAHTKLNAGNLESNIKIDLHTGNSPNSNPFDPAQIPDPNGYTVQVTPGKRIGF